MNLKRVVTLVLGGAALLSVAYGISWLASSWSHFTSQITMHYGSGSNVSPSTSMELYEINLRRMQVDTDRKETGRILEWKLAVPRAFLIDEIGKNGTPYTEKNSDATAYGVDLAMQASEDLKSFVPKTLVTEKGKIPRDIIIGFSNNLTDSKGTSIGFIVENDLCVRAEDEQQEAAKLHEHGYSGWCHDEDYRCLISAQLDGWGIGFNVTKDLYSRPLEACAMTKDFLNKYTIKRDDGHTVAKGATP